ncbi:29180_t:CDS:2, partial [Racocetra persica]
IHQSGPSENVIIVFSFSARSALRPLTIMDHQQIGKVAGKLTTRVINTN